MSEITITVDLLNDSTISSEIKGSIASKAFTKIYPEIEQKVLNNLSKKIDVMCDVLVKEFIGREITITDQWGEIKVFKTSIRDTLKKRFDEFWMEEVDRKGNNRFHAYGELKPRFIWEIQKLIEDHTKVFNKELLDMMISFEKVGKFGIAN